ncbi:MAG TPA: oligoendopeptidase F [Thermoflexales bacterium]|nr:oligoendopeptidase F [Thermoflexales bacterium]HQZ22325.1 oligoendopeptidase F [Thermoflexales bacterium]
MSNTQPLRQNAPTEATWNLVDLFPTAEAWEAAFAAADKKIPKLKAYQGTLGASADALLKWMRELERMAPAISQIAAYASLRSDEDMGNQANGALNSRAQALAARFGAAVSFATPEILSIKPAALKKFLAEKPALQKYAHYFDNIQRQKPHVRSAEVEELLAAAAEPFGMGRLTYNALADADISYGAAKGKGKTQAQVGRGNIGELLGSPDRKLRQNAWWAYSDGFLGMKNTFAGIFAAKVKATVWAARARGFQTSLDYALSGPNVPTEVYHNVIAACNRNLPIWHRYWDIKRRILKLDKLEEFDIFAPIGQPPQVGYPQAVEWICAGLRPLGDAYVRVAKDGMTAARWVDSFPNTGKRNGAYSHGVFGVHPYILMSYHDEGLFGMSTLAHEMGHAMHSYYSNATQPFVLARYTLFAAEVASNFNQAMVRAHLLAQNPDRNFQIAIIEEAMSNFHRYLFLMPILSQFELWMHTQVEQGKALTANGMNAALAELFTCGYGPAMLVDEARAGITWAQFGHFFSDFYVYQYASGIAAANALADIVLAEGQPAVQKYLRFLHSGGALYPLEALKLAGIDMSTPAPMDRAFKVMEGFVDRLEKLA